jgi:hypothetical protein
MVAYRAPIRVQLIEQTNVYNPLGVRIGRIEGLLVDPSTGVVKYGLVLFDFQGMEYEQLIVPWPSLSYHLPTRRFHCSATESQVRVAPRGLPSELDSALEWRLARHFSVGARPRGLR